MDIKVLLFADDVVSKKIYTLLQDDEIRIVGKINDENKVLDEINKSKPNIVLIHSNNENVLFRVSQQIYLLRPKSIPIIITDDYNGDFLQKTTQIGINYVLPTNIEGNLLIKQLKSIMSNENIRFNALENAVGSNWKSKVLTVFSTKGGVGKTTVVTNLAIKLAQNNRKVAILDFDLEFGEVSYNLRMNNKENIIDLLQEESSPNADVIRKYMGVHSSGVNVLAAPNSPEYSEYVSSNQVEKIISNIRSYYDYIIIDTSTGFNGINLACFDLSSTILFVTEMNLASLRSTKKGLSILNSLVGDEKIKLIIGKDNPGRVKQKDVFKAMEFPVFANLGYDEKTAVEALNVGSPAVLTAPNSKLSKHFDKLVDIIDVDLEDDGKGGKKKKSKSKTKSKTSFLDKLPKFKKGDK